MIEDQRRLAEVVTCPVCHAAPGVSCDLIEPSDGRAKWARRDWRAGFHHNRFRDAATATPRRTP